MGKHCSNIENDKILGRWKVDQNNKHCPWALCEYDKLTSNSQKRLFLFRYTFLFIFMQGITFISLTFAL